MNNPLSEEDDVEQERERLEELRETLKVSNGVAPTELLVRCLRDKLLSKPCRNQGFVLDGFPVKMEETTQLYMGTYQL